MYKTISIKIKSLQIEFIKKKGNPFSLSGHTACQTNRKKHCSIVEDGGRQDGGERESVSE